MHEMSLVTGILSIIQEEMSKSGAHKLQRVKVCYGELTNIVPDSLQFAFKIFTEGTNIEGAILEIEKIPLTLRCSNCLSLFTPEDKQKIFFITCPSCKKEVAYNVETGREFYIQHLEVE